ncbi:hypothetical protein X737_16550 [Mesorhizobium sp. L48C026A00]|nr:hypothetical protein X737_16550 [Mesorhizobium sp. L48C026A00]
MFMSPINRWRKGLMGVHRERDGSWSGSLLKKPVMLCRRRMTLNAGATTGP